LRLSDTLFEERIIRHCVACGHDALYIQKDFNRNLGVVIVAVGSLISLFFFSRSQPVYGMLALGTSAAVDFVIYKLVGDVTVCYACHAVYRGFLKNPKHSAFDLKDLEKYGGREPRF
jgi:hypothetical protein